MLVKPPPMRRDPSRFRRLAVALVAGGSAFAVALAGCGSRGPLDDTPIADGASEVSPDAAVTTDTGLGRGRDAGGPAACGACLVTTCSQAIFGCLQSSSCRAVL